MPIHFQSLSLNAFYNQSCLDWIGASVDTSSVVQQFNQIYTILSSVKFSGNFSRFHTVLTEEGKDTDRHKSEIQVKERDMYSEESER